MAVTGNRIDVQTYLEIDRDEIGRRIGYARDAELSPRIASLVDDYLARAKYLIDPVYTYAIRDIREVDHPVVAIDGDVELESQVISQVMERCTGVALFALTIGSQLEETTTRLGEEGLITDAFVLDAIGSSYTEKAADFVQGIIGELAQLKGMAISRRFSPGYCDWHISQQRIIFETLGPGSDISLSDDYLMSPEKSVSAIIGIGTAESGVSTYTPCSTCEKHHCLWRRP